LWEKENQGREIAEAEGKGRSAAEKSDARGKGGGFRKSQTRRDQEKFSGIRGGLPSTRTGHKLSISLGMRRSKGKKKKKE